MLNTPSGKMLVKDATNEHTDLSSMLWPNVKKEEKKNTLCNSLDSGKKVSHTTIID